MISENYLIPNALADVFKGLVLATFFEADEPELHRLNFSSNNFDYAIFKFIGSVDDTIRVASICETLGGKKARFDRLWA